MKNKKINLCKILKNKENAKIYCTLFGYGNVTEINQDHLIIQDKYGTTWYFDPDGRYNDEDCEEGECLLFPSKDNRDWSSWKNPKPKPKKERFDPKALKPFDNVLVRDYDEDDWRIDIFSNICNGMRKDSMRCIGRTWYQCIPYNDDTKHLVGTIDEAPEYYRYWED